MLNINNLLKDFNQGFWSRKFTGWTLHPTSFVTFIGSAGLSSIEESLATSSESRFCKFPSIRNESSGSLLPPSFSVCALAPSVTTDNIDINISLIFFIATSYTQHTLSLQRYTKIPKPPNLPFGDGSFLAKFSQKKNRPHLG